MGFLWGNREPKNKNEKKKRKKVLEAVYREAKTKTDSKTDYGIRGD